MLHVENHDPKADPTYSPSEGKTSHTMLRTRKDKQADQATPPTMQEITSQDKQADQGRCYPATTASTIRRKTTKKIRPQPKRTHICSHKEEQICVIINGSKQRMRIVPCCKKHRRHTSWSDTQSQRNHVRTDTGTSKSKTTHEKTAGGQSRINPSTHRGDDQDR